MAEGKNERPKTWFIGEFFDRKRKQYESAIVPNSWRTGDLQCKFPSTTDKFRLNTLTKEGGPYKNDWKTETITRILINDISDYEEAVKLLKISENCSDLEEAKKKMDIQSPVRKTLKSNDKNSAVEKATKNLFPVLPAEAVKPHGASSSSQNAGVSAKLHSALSSSQNGGNGKVSGKKSGVDEVPKRCGEESSTNYNDDDTNRTAPLPSGGQVIPKQWVMTKEFANGLFREIVDIKGKLKEINEKLEQLVSGGRANVISSRFVLVGPLTTKSEWDVLNERLRSENDLQDKLVEELSLTGGKQLTTAFGKIMEKVMTRVLASEFSWKGKRSSTLLQPKFQFSNTPISNSVLGALRNILGSVRENDYQSVAELWLQQSPFVSGLKKKKVRVLESTATDKRKTPRKTPQKSNGDAIESTAMNREMPQQTPQKSNGDAQTSTKSLNQQNPEKKKKDSLKGAKDKQNPKRRRKQKDSEEECVISSDERNSYSDASDQGDSYNDNPFIIREAGKR